MTAVSIVGPADHDVGAGTRVMVVMLNTRESVAEIWTKFGTEPSTEYAP